METTTATTQRAIIDTLGAELTARGRYPTIVAFGDVIHNLSRQRLVCRSATDSMLDEIARQLTRAKQQADDDDARRAAVDAEAAARVAAAPDASERLNAERFEETRRLVEYRRSAEGQRETTIALLTEIRDLLHQQAGRAR